MIFRKLLSRALAPLPPRRFIAAVAAMVVLLGVGFTALNYAANDFGLWRHRDSARIWAVEKTSKYLLAHRYIPENFDAIMIGSSVSDNLDTRKIEKYRVYNLSMAGGNITETAAAARKYLEAPGEKSLLIVSLHPYLTKNSGMKSFQIDESEVAGSLFSIIPINIWLAKLQHFAGIGDAALEQSEAGWNHFDEPRDEKAIEEIAIMLRRDLEERRKNPDAAPARALIDPAAMAELDALLTLARSKGVRIAAYYHPQIGVKFDFLEATGEWADYRAQMEKIFAPGEIILDMNGPEYAVLRNDPEAYFDGSHLTQHGAGQVLQALNRALAAHD
ncbi:MAG: hypothetical protein HYU57_06395 [Micavibrio aeruginosavorus]|nr:hypothetical protein [Micavibrio aeruginosavorus]